MNYISNVSFKAKLISPSTVVVKSADGKKAMASANFVKLSPNDLPQLDLFASKCSNSDLAKKINYNLNNASGSDNRHYFAMTLQNENLHELDSNKIIGVAETTLKNGVFYLDYLQTVTKESFMNSKYSYIGTSMISGIINQAKKLKTGFIRLHALPSAERFYKTLNFVSIKNGNFELRYANYDKMLTQNTKLMKRALNK